MLNRAKFLCFPPKNWKSCNFFIFWPILLKLHISAFEMDSFLTPYKFRRRKVALHTSSHLTPTEAWRSADCTSSEGRRVSSEVRLGNCTQVWGVDQIWRAWVSRLRKNSTSHLFWLAQTCSDLRTIQWSCTLVSQCHFLHFRTLLFFSLTSFPAEIAYFNSPNRQLSNGARVMELC